MKTTHVLACTGMLFAGLTLAANGQTASDAVSGASLKALQEKGFVKINTDAISGATEKREKGSGAIAFVDNEDGKDLLHEMIKEFVWTADTVWDGKKVLGGRNMFSMATAHNNTPQSITAELTLDYDKAAKKFYFYGTTAKDSGKILRAAKSGTGMSISWVKQLREEEFKKYGWNYYDSYGIQFEADLEIITSKEITGPENIKALDRLVGMMDKSLVTIKEWNLLWSFDKKLKGEELQKAKRTAALAFMSYEDFYVVKPTKMVVIAYYYRPLMVSAKSAFVYDMYKIDSSKKGFKLDKAKGYQLAVRDANCMYVVSKQGRKEYTYLDGHYAASSPKNLISRTVAYKNKRVFGTDKPAAGATPLPQALAAIEALYNGKGNVKSLAEVEAAIKAAAPGKEATYFWVDNKKAADMPDHYMVTYTGLDSNARPYRVDLPNWNRYFALQPGNMCGLTTRQSLIWKN